MWIKIGQHNARNLPSTHFLSGPQHINFSIDKHVITLYKFMSAYVHTSIYIQMLVLVSLVYSNIISTDLRLSNKRKYIHIAIFIRLTVTDVQIFYEWSNTKNWISKPECRSKMRRFTCPYIHMYIFAYI